MIVAIVLALQAASPTSAQLPPAPWPQPLEENAEEQNALLKAQAGKSGAARLSTPQARQTAQRFGYCVADNSPVKAAQTLAIDFTSREYRRSLDVLVQNNAGCFGKRGRLRGNSLLFAGAIAERLLTREPSPLNARLARAATSSAKPVTPSDAIAMCVVRSAPDETATLLQSQIASEDEVQAADKLDFVVARCTTAIAPMTVSADGLRAMLATAAFRTLQTGATPGTTN